MNMDFCHKKSGQVFSLLLLSYSVGICFDVLAMSLALLYKMKKLPKWDSEAHQGIFLDFSDVHSSLIPCIFNQYTQHVSPQYHVILMIPFWPFLFSHQSKYMIWILMNFLSWLAHSMWNHPMWMHSAPFEWWMALLDSDVFLFLLPVGAPLLSVLLLQPLQCLGRFLALFYFNLQLQRKLLLLHFDPPLVFLPLSSLTMLLMLVQIYHFWHINNSLYTFAGYTPSLPLLKQYWLLVWVPACDWFLLEHRGHWEIVVFSCLLAASVHALSATRSWSQPPPLDTNISSQVGPVYLYVKVYKLALTIIFLLQETGHLLTPWYLKESILSWLHICSSASLLIQLPWLWSMFSSISSKPRFLSPIWQPYLGIGNELSQGRQVVGGNGGWDEYLWARSQSMAVSQWGTLYGGSSKHLDFSAQWPDNEILDLFLCLWWISDQGCWFVRNNVTLCSVEHAQYHHSVIQSH